MKEETEDVIARLKGKKLPPVCPHCGKRLYDIYSSEPAITWSDSHNGYIHSPYYGEEPTLCCSNCNIRLDPELANEILEGL